MFEWGSADLILTEPDLLTAGVEISVQPPGKKINPLNLIVVEKSSLGPFVLVIRVKTIPFCHSGVVEAALDEANVKSAFW